jgi:hypothetical protein
LYRYSVGHGHSHGHAAEDGPGMEKVFLCSALKQIVNGVNYKLTLGRTEGACDVTAEVYKSFDDVYEVKQPRDDTPTEGA